MSEPAPDDSGIRKLARIFREPTRPSPVGWLAGAALLIAAFALSWMFYTNAENAVMTERLAQLQQQVEELKADREADERQDSQLKRQWQLIGFNKDQITELRVKAGLPVASPPGPGD